MTEKQLAKKILDILKIISEACENYGPVYQAIENFRYALIEIIEE